MSLFGNPEYQWRETYFVMFEDGAQPQAETVKAELQKLGKNFEIESIRANDNGQLESVTIIAHDDFAAMDISLVSGEEVVEQLDDLVEQLTQNVATGDEQAQVKRIPSCIHRYDVMHFEKHSFETLMADDTDEGFMDPGGVLILLERLGELCNGVIVDPQSNALM